MEDQVDEARSDNEADADEDEAEDDEDEDEDESALSMLGTSAGDMAIACPLSRKCAASTCTEEDDSFVVDVVADVAVVGAAVVVPT